MLTLPQQPALTLPRTLTAAARRRLQGDYEYFGAAAEGRSDVPLSELDCLYSKPARSASVAAPRRAGSPGPALTIPTLCVAESPEELDQQELRFLTDFVQVAAAAVWLPAWHEVRDTARHAGRIGASGLRQLSVPLCAAAHGRLPVPPADQGGVGGGAGGRLLGAGPTPASCFHRLLLALQLSASLCTGSAHVTHQTGLCCALCCAQFTLPCSVKWDAMDNQVSCRTLLCPSILSRTGSSVCGCHDPHCSPPPRLPISRLRS